MRRNSIVIAFFVLVAAAGFILWYALPVNPTRALMRAFANAGSAKHAGAIMTFGMLMPQKNGQPLPLAVHGVVQTDAPVGGGGAAADALLTLLDAGGGGKDAYLELRALPDGKTYLRFSGMPAAALASVPGGANDRWYSIDRRVLGAAFLTGGMGAKPVLADPTQSLADVSAARARLAAGFASGSFFVTDGSSYSETIDGVPSYRFALRLKPEIAGQVAEDVATVLLGRGLTVDERAQADAAGASDIEAVVWVDKRAMEFRKVQVDAASATGTGERRSVIFDEINYTTPSGVAAPEDAAPLSDTAQDGADKSR